MTYEDSRLQDVFEKAFEEGAKSFLSCTRFYSFFHIGFITFLCLQLLAFLLFFSYFSQSLIAACGLALFFLTVFSYLVLLFFFQAKKPQQLLAICSRFEEICSIAFPFPKEQPDFLLSRAHAFQEFAFFLTEQELDFYDPLIPIASLRPLIQKFTIWVHWKNFHQMKELLLEKTVRSLIAAVKVLPTDEEIHATLAVGYINLCKLYVHPKKLHSSLPWISPEYSSSSMKDSFSFYAQKAIEECKILQDLQPKNPWVLAHLAEIYHLQEKTQEEIHSCEELLSLTPNNTDLLFQLGVLYFQEGQPGKGLQIYKQLQEDCVDKAQRLIEYYA